MPAVLLATNYAASDRSHENAAAAQWGSILYGNPPADAILVSNDRDEMTPLWYYQYVEGKRPDIAGLFPQVGPVERWGNVGQVLDGALRTRRPVLLLKPMQGLDVKFRIDYGGALPRVVGPAVEKAPDKQVNVLFGEAVRLNGYDAASFAGTRIVDADRQPVLAARSPVGHGLHVLRPPVECVGGGSGAER